MNNNILPRFDAQPLSVCGLRITEKQRAYIPALLDATGAPTVSALIRLLINSADSHAVYSPVAESRPYSISYKLQSEQKHRLEELRSAYNARTVSDVVCYLLNQAIAILDAGKDGE